MAPFFIVESVSRSIAFYRDLLGFEVVYQDGGEGEPFFAMLRRDSAMLMVKADEVAPLPNHERHPRMRWDAYVHSPDPDALAAEFTGRGVALSKPIEDTEEGLRAFEIADVDGHVLCFGRPSD